MLWRTHQHPELKMGELYLANFNQKRFDNCGWNTKRKGNQPYLQNGTPCSEENLFPVFVEVVEMMKKGVNPGAASFM